MAKNSVVAGLDRILTMELVRVTERAAVAAARLRGRGDEKAADQIAVDAMRAELNRLDIKGTVVIGEGERDEAPMLYIGEEVGSGDGPEVDIALDPLEGTTICAKNLPNALAVIAIAEKGSLLFAPDVYMDKIAIGPGYPDGVIDIDASPFENIRNLADAKRVPISEITACILDRPRHAKLIEAVRNTGAAIRLIGDGDVAGVIHTTDPDETGIDIYLGTGGAPEGVLAAAALRCTGGQMQRRLLLATPVAAARTVECLQKDCRITNRTDLTVVEFIRLCQRPLRLAPIFTQRIRPPVWLISKWRVRPFQRVRVGPVQPTCWAPPRNASAVRSPIASSASNEPVWRNHSGWDLAAASRSTSSLKSRNSRGGTSSSEAAKKGTARPLGMVRSWRRFQ
jgi:fructose-1,6-bisphosphatase II / sedoheptulose-1,7-bisphosphatase